VCYKNTHIIHFRELKHSPIFETLSVEIIFAINSKAFYHFTRSISFKILSMNIKINNTIKDSLGRDTYLNHYAEIDCSIGSSPYGHSSEVDRAIRSLDLKSLSSYQDMYFDPNLMSEILKKWGKHNVDKSEIFFGHGIFNLIERILYKLLDTSDGMLGYGPQFNEIPSEIKLAGGSYTPIPMTSDFRFPFEGIMKELEKDNAYSLIFIDNPNNPTGQITELSKLEKIIAAAEKKGICVIIDEAYGEFMEDENSAFTILSKYSNLIVTRSFSKAYGLASMRVGYCGVSEDIVPYFRKIDVPFEPTLVSSVGATKAFSDHTFLNNVVEKVKIEKEIIIKGLEKLGISVLPTNNSVSILCIHKEGVNLVELFKKCGIKVVSGQSFNNTNSIMDDSFARLRMPGSEVKCIEIINRLEEVLL
jgi:histidinol-phosphate aminotransferase